ncbi:hypothetical protein [Streptomyces sp. WAC01526]|uniref:hypothetical protein n=1 Tax=Streptomyces sp. WAC01526 TaxID=2588709 RepID=UPI0011DF446E|nr:hypothetical protein [Streptomyces sp. WAC01526]
MSNQTMSDIAAPLRLLRLLAADFPDLPAMNVDVSTIFPDQLELVSHDDFGAFEAWRSVLGIQPETVTYGEQSEGRTRVLRAAVDYGGARLSLVAYSTVPGHEGGEVL